MTGSVAVPTTTIAASTASALPLSISLRSGIDGASDFSPFRDLQSLTGGNAFTFRDLIRDGVDGDQNVLLFRSGCSVDGKHDCTRACKDASLIYSSLETFYNCAALSAIAYWNFQEYNLTISDEAERNASSIMGEGSLADFDSRPVLNSFISCSKEACDDDGLSEPCNSSVTSLSEGKSTPKQIFFAMEQFCPELSADINPDIFGPGVRTSQPPTPSRFSTSHVTLAKFFSGADIICPPSMLLRYALHPSQGLQCLRQLYPEASRDQAREKSNDAQPHRDHNLAGLVSSVPYEYCHSHNAR